MSEEYQIVEWRQAELPEFSHAKQAADVWAALEKIEQQSHWWKVEILKQVSMNKWMNDFLVYLREAHNIELSKAYANELRRLGVALEELPVMTVTMKERIEELPVATAVKVIRAEDLETAVTIAETQPRKELDSYLVQEKILKADPLAPLQLRLFNSWNFSEAIHGNPGYEWGYNSGHITENLLWYYTEPNDLVIDPMVGSGTTVDACNRMNRRVLALDKEEDFIRNGIDTDEHADFIFLDPPFYSLKQNDFQSYDAFIAFVDRAIEESIKVLKIGGHLALIMMNLCTSLERRGMVGDCYRLLTSGVRDAGAIEFENMIVTPLSTQQPGADRAKTNRELLNIARVVWVFKRVE